MRASIDLGSNSVLLLVLDDAGNTVHDEARVVGLGKGLGDRGLFRPDRMDATFTALEDYARRAAALGVAPKDIRAAATSASRRAMNADTFYERVRAQTGIAFEIIPGEEEARLTFLGAAMDLDLGPGLVGVVDLGGGSTELALGQDGHLLHRVSLELGTVRLTEAFFGEAPDRIAPRDLGRLREHVEATVAGGWSQRPRHLVAVAGTATTLAAMELGLSRWDRDAVHGSRLSRQALRRWMDRLLDTDAAGRLTLAAVSPERAPYLLAGAVVLEAVACAAHQESLRISDGGLRHGLLRS